MKNTNPDLTEPLMNIHTSPRTFLLLLLRPRVHIFSVFSPSFYYYCYPV
jgi:hypothetical protein